MFAKFSVVQVLTNLQLKKGKLTKMFGKFSYIKKCL